MNAYLGTSLWLLPEMYMPILNTIMVVVIAPSVLRVFSLQFISSSMHYFGNVHSVLEQTQVFTHWIFKPLQFFCVDFGATHGMHHIRVPQPFYIRHFIRKECYPAMRENGIRFNDFSTFKHANELIK